MARSGAGQRAWLPPPRCWSSLLLRVALVVLSSAASARWGLLPPPPPPLPLCRPHVQPEHLECRLPSCWLAHLLIELRARPAPPYLWAQ